MPYIPKIVRAELMPRSYAGAIHSGELNFQLTALVVDYVCRKGGVTYAGINDVIGALECCKAEFLRRVAAPYEDKKIAENGDVYPKELL